MTRVEPARVSPAVWRLAWVIVFGAFASGLDASLANIGLHTIQADLRTSLGLVQWISSGYLLALAVSLPICGWLGRRVGVGRLWLAALAAFTVASGLCALAPTIGWLIGARVAQGLAAGLLIPAGQTILGQAVGPGRLGRVMATLGIAVTLAPALGPLIGAFVLRELTWPWLFLVNLPVGAVGLALGLRLVPRGRPGAAPALDWRGFAYVGTGLPLVVYGLTTWGAGGAVASWAVPLGAGVLGLVAFALRRSTLLDLSLYRNPVFAAASGAAWCSGAVMFGAALVLPLYFQILHGDGVLATGLRLASFGAGTAVLLPLSGRLTDRHGGGIVSLWGNAIAVAALAAFALAGAAANPVLVQALLLLLGAAIGLGAVPPTAAAYRTVRPDQLPDATAQVVIGQRVGGALGAALFAVILAGALPAGADHAFRLTFWCLTGTAAVALACSAWLRSALRRASLRFSQESS